MSKQATDSPENTHVDLGPDLRLRIDKFPPGGRDIEFVAEPEQLESLSNLMGVSSLNACEVILHIARRGKGFHVTGRMTANCTQPCVVTLEPIIQQINVALDRLFLPANLQKDEPGPGSETYIDLSGGDPPDYLDGDILDLTPLIVETLGMEIELYPRKPGAEVAADQQAEPEPGPFAALAALKADTEGDQ